MVNKPSIVVCDDNEHYGWAIKYNLRKEIDVEIVADTDALLNFLQASSADLILLDIELRTTREGLDRLQEIKRIAPNVPIIIASGHTDLNYVREAFQNGVLDFLSKDASPDEIRFTVQNAIRVAQGPAIFRTLHESLEEFEKQKVIEAIKQSSGNQTKAAKLLGIDRTSLFRKLKKMNLETKPSSGNPDKAD